LGWELVLAWLVAGFCSLLAARLLRVVRRSGPPAPAALLEELLSEVGANSFDSDPARRAAIADLNRRLSDVSFELGSLPARFTALTRISLASGTALALFGYIGAQGNPRQPVERVLSFVVCAASGALGAACVANIGRMAKRRSSVIREEWDRSSREVGKVLGTSLSVPARSERDAV
jgi:hypothetical protein